MKFVYCKEFQNSKSETARYTICTNIKGRRKTFFNTSYSFLAFTLQNLLDEAMLFVLFQKNGKQHKKYINNNSKNKRQR